VCSSDLNLNGFNKELTVSAGTSGTARAGINIQGSRTTDSTFGALSYYHQANLVGSVEMIRGGADNSGIMQFFTANAGTTAERMRIDSSGNVGIGTSSQTLKLEVLGDGTPAGFYRNIDVTVVGPAGMLVNLGAKNGSTPTPGAAIGAILDNPATTGTMLFYTRSSSTLSERARIDSSGNLLVGKTVTSIGTAGTWIEGTGSLVSSLAASTSSSSTLHAYSTTASAYRFYVGMDGRVNATLTTISAISDERLKENIKDLDFGLSEVLSLKPRRFDWKEGKGADTKDAVGFIAQEFETVFPNSVGTAKAGEDGIEYKNICHDELIPTLVKAIQEQQAIIQTLTDRITALETPTGTQA
jgi:hypothetical protein